jgi:tetratricopeptide (TPR) repeat protein
MWILDLAFSPDGKTLFASGKNGWLRSFDAETGRSLATFRGHTAVVNSLAVLPDGKTLISTSDDGTIKLWDVSTGQERVSFRGHQGKAVGSVTVAPDGKTFATGGDDGTVKLWRAAMDEEAYARKTELDQDDPNGAIALMNESDALRTSGRFDAAAKVYSQAEARLSKLAAVFPKEPEYHNRLASYHRGLARALNQNGQLEQSEKHFRRAISIWEKLSADVPAERLHYATKAGFTSSFELASLYAARKQPLQLEEAMRQSVDRWEKLTHDLPNSTFIASHLRQCQFNLAGLLAANGRPEEADRAYSRLLKLAPRNAVGHNDLAWLLATCPDSKFRDPKRAVELAKKAVELDQNAGTNWNTLGVAHYRAGDWKAAIEALKKSDELLKGKELSFNAFFLAMAQWRLGNKAEARKWYDQAVQWMEKNQPKNEELVRFRAEAEKLLELMK